MANSSLSAKLMNKLAEVPDPRDEKFEGQQLGSQLYLQKVPPRPKPIEEGKLQDDIAAARRHDTWAVLVFVRLVNAITICTFFQPDEYYQALEPAWELAFGTDSGAWITWVCSAKSHDEYSTRLTAPRNGNISYAHHSTPSC